MAVTLKERTCGTQTVTDSNRQSRTVPDHGRSWEIAHRVGDVRGVDEVGEALAECRPEHAVGVGGAGPIELRVRSVDEQREGGAARMQRPGVAPVMPPHPVPSIRATEGTAHGVGIVYCVCGPGGRTARQLAPRSRP